jgi:serine/tyrosine/threonine adenylyltransferase
MFNTEQQTFTQLPPSFYTRVNPTPVHYPTLIQYNHALAKRLGLTETNPDVLAGWFSGNVLPPGADPVALVYAGHQFGHFVPRLGDGRAILLGEMLDAGGVRLDVQLKGSGQTLYSRRGDGRAALAPVLREYLISHFMSVVGIPTTLSLAAVTTGENVSRETLLPGAILTRVATSHIRIGTFEYFASREDRAGVKTLADYVIDRHYPAVRELNNPYLGLLEAVLNKQATLVAQWQGIGFIHGVMNTDNISMVGETLDYGPCAFMDTYNPQTVFSSIDRDGRYAYGNQPIIMHWNLSRLAESLLPLLDDRLEQAVDKAQDVLATFTSRYVQAWQKVMRSKLGLTAVQTEDGSMFTELFTLMKRHKLDHTLTFYQLVNKQEIPELREWLPQYKGRLDVQGGAVVSPANPLYIPRNHLVEQALEEAVKGDYTAYNTLYQVLSNPFTVQEGRDRYALAPKPSDRVYQTFCGT